MNSKYKMRLEKLVSSVIHEEGIKSGFGYNKGPPGPSSAGSARRAAALGLVGSGAQDLLHKVFVGELVSASDHKTTFNAVVGECTPNKSSPGLYSFKKGNYEKIR